jgi:hypothetical protein
MDEEDFLHNVKARGKKVQQMTFPWRCDELFALTARYVDFVALQVGVFSLLILPCSPPARQASGFVH